MIGSSRHKEAGSKFSRVKTNNEISYDDWQMGVLITSSAFNSKLEAQ
jgi:hypothetical protein